MVSCDKIDEPYTSKIPAKDWYGKKVLIEDYTGHRCPNCPGAANDANTLKTLYGEKVIVMAVHAGFFANPAPPIFPEDFRTEAGDAWNTYFGNSSAGNPNGMVNRKGFPSSSHILSSGAWGGKVATTLSEIPDLELKITKTFNSADTSVSGKITAKFLKTIKKKLKLQIVITEDSIIAPQVNGSINDLNYVHRHMLRGSINGVWGNTLTDGSSYTAIDTELTENFIYKLKQEWKSKHCSIICFVYDDITKEILQAEETHIE